MKTLTNFLPVFDLTPFTMLDYPHHTACVVWFAGCNLRCGYCHNPEMVRCGKGGRSMQEVMDFLHKRAGLLDGVVLSGGEATLYPDLLELAREIKAMGYKIKLDTNGSRPQIVRQLVAQHLVDYIALDYKAPREKFTAVTGRPEKLYDAFADTLDFLCASQEVDFEVRTTVHTDLLDEADIRAIMADLTNRGYRGTYYVQNFRECETLGILTTQAQPLDAAHLPAPAGYRLEVRNF